MIKNNNDTSPNNFANHAEDSDNKLTNNQSTDEELAALWNQHEFCPKCGSKKIKEIDERVRVLFFHSYHVKKYVCNNCQCQWL